METLYDDAIVLKVACEEGSAVMVLNMECTCRTWFEILRNTDSITRELWYHIMLLRFPRMHSMLLIFPQPLKPYRDIYRQQLEAEHFNCMEITETVPSYSVSLSSYTFTFELTLNDVLGPNPRPLLGRKVLVGRRSGWTGVGRGRDGVGGVEGVGAVGDDHLAHLHKVV